MDEETRAAFDALQVKVDRLTDTLDEFLPLIRAYLDPQQAGPRGYFMRRRLAVSTNGNPEVVM